MQAPPRGMAPGQVPMQQASGQDSKAAAISNVGAALKQTSNLAIELKNEQERQNFSDAELALRRSSKDLASQLAKNFNPSEHFEIAEKHFDAQKASILAKGDFSPTFYKEMDKRISSFTYDKLEQIGTEAKLMQLENGRKLHDAVVQEDILDKNYSGALEKWNEGEGVYRGKDETEMGRMKIERLIKEDRWDGLALQGDKGVFKNEKMTEPQREKWERKAEAYHSEIVGEQTDQALESIFSGELIDPDDIEGITPDLDSKTRYQLKKTLEGLHGEEAKRVMESPVFRDQISGEIAKDIADYNPTGSGYDAQRVEIRSKIAMLPTGPMKQEFERQVAEIKMGKLKEIKSVTDWALAQVDEHLEDGLYGDITKPKAPMLSKTLRQHVKDGFLEDTDKMKSLGFSDDQIEEIRGANEDTDPSFFGSIFPDNEVTLGAQAEKFKDLWDKRSGDVTADQDALLIANALSGGRAGLDKEQSKSIDDKSFDELKKNARDKNSKIMQKYGEDRRKLLDHLKLNPNIDVMKASIYLKEMKINVGAGVTDDKWRSSRPTYDDVRIGDYTMPGEDSPLFDNSDGTLDFGVLPSVGGTNINE